MSASTYMYIRVQTNVYSSKHMLYNDLCSIQTVCSKKYWEKCLNALQLVFPQLNFFCKKKSLEQSKSHISHSVQYFGVENPRLCHLGSRKLPRTSLFWGREPQIVSLRFQETASDLSLATEGRARGGSREQKHSKHTQINLNKQKARLTLSLPQTSRTNPVHFYSTNQENCPEPEPSYLSAYVTHYIKHKTRLSPPRQNSCVYM